MNYLDYMAEPDKNKRISIGIIVLLFLGVLFVLRLRAEARVLEGRPLARVRHPHGARADRSCPVALQRRPRAAR